MNPTPNRSGEIDSSLAQVGRSGLADLFHRHRAQLRLLVARRLDRKITPRVDPSDVIQEAYLEAHQRLSEYQRNTKLQPYPWIRFLTMQRLAIVHRRHLDAQQRDVRRECRVSTQPSSSSNDVDAIVATGEPTPSQLLEHLEQLQQLAVALKQLEPLDRQILTLKHFQFLSTQQIADVFEISFASASQRYYRALKKLRQTLREVSSGKLSDP